MSGRSAGTTLVFINNFDGSRRPTELQGSLLEMILTFRTLLVLAHLPRGGLPNVDAGPAGQMRGLNLRGHHALSPGSGRYGFAAVPTRPTAGGVIDRRARASRPRRRLRVWEPGWVLNGIFARHSVGLRFGLVDQVPERSGKTSRSLREQRPADARLSGLTSESCSAAWLIGDLRASQDGGSGETVTPPAGRSEKKAERAGQSGFSR